MSDRHGGEDLENVLAVTVSASGTTYLIDSVRTTPSRTRPLDALADKPASSRLRRGSEQRHILKVPAMEVTERALPILEPLVCPERTTATARSPTPIVSIEWIAPLIVEVGRLDGQ